MSFCSLQSTRMPPTRQICACWLSVVAGMLVVGCGTTPGCLALCTLAGLGAGGLALSPFLNHFVRLDADDADRKLPKRFVFVVKSSGIDAANLVPKNAPAYVANRDQALQAGLRATHIEAAPPCTACHTDWFFSHRKQGPATGRMWAIAWIPPQPH